MGMKHLRKWVLLGLVLLLLAMTPCAMAEPMDPDSRNDVIIDCNYEPRVMPGEELFYYLTPEKTGTYMIITHADQILQAELVDHTPSFALDLPTGEHYECYELTAGKGYTIRVFLNPEKESQYPNGYADTFCVTAYQELQGIALSATELTGNRDDYQSLYVEVDPYYSSMEGLTWVSSDPQIVRIESTEGRDCGFRLLKVGTATVTATLGNFSASCTVTVEKGSNEWDDYEVWPVARTSWETTLPNGQAQQFTYTPEEDGEYVLWVADGQVHTDLQQTSWFITMPSRHLFTAKMDYMVYELLAGETYILTVVSNTMDSQTQAGTVCLEKIRSLESGYIRSAEDREAKELVGYVGGMAGLGAITEPDYAVDKLSQWLSEDNSVATVTQDSSSHSAELFLLKAGKTKISAVVEGKVLSINLTVLDSPVLQLGKAITVQNKGITGLICYFTPDSTDTYRFTLKGGGGTVYLEDTEYGKYYEESCTLSCRLTGGKTYEIHITLEQDPITIRVDRAGSSGEKDPTEPDVEVTEPNNSSQPDTIDPSGGDTVPSNPTEPTDPIAPSDPTEPSEVPPESQPAENTPALQNPVQVEDGKATVIAEQLQQLLEAMQPGEILELDAEGSAVTVFVLEKQALEQLTAAGVALAVKLPAARITLDTAALAAICEQTGEELILQCQILEPNALSTQQQAAMEGKTVDGIVQLELQSAGGQIHDFQGGTATVQLNNISATPMQVYYLAPDGSMEKLDTEQQSGSLIFRTGHFSEYVLIRVEQSTDYLLLILAGVAILLGVGAATAVFLLRKKTKLIQAQ